nr:hypothetical protein [Tanacetum cinerariifolium]
MPQDQEENPGNDDEEPKGKVASKRNWFTKPKRPQEHTDPDWNDRKNPQQGPTQNWLMTLLSFADKQSKTFDKLMSNPIDFSAYIINRLKITNLNQETLLGPAFRLFKSTLESTSGDYPFDLTKPLPLVKIGNRQKTKAAQYDLTGIKDMAQNIWSPVKVAYDKHAFWGISHWRDQLTQIKVMRKHGYGYLKEIVVRRADNDLYKFKEGDFLRLRINDNGDMLLLVVQNRLTNLLGDDDSHFIIDLRMFTRSIVIQKRVEDLQLAVESYQIKINVTKPETTKLKIKKKDPYTPYQDLQGLIYVDTLRRNRLIRSDELYKFSDGTLTKLQTSLEDITQNIHMEYLPNRRWSTLEKKRTNIMNKGIDKQLKERRMMRCLEKFVGERHYGTDLQLL